MKQAESLSSLSVILHVVKVVSILDKNRQMKKKVSENLLFE